MNRRQAIKTGITATAAIALSGCKNKPVETAQELSTFDKLALLPREYHNDNTNHTAFNNHLYACNPKEPPMIFAQGKWQSLEIKHANPIKQANKTYKVI